MIDMWLIAREDNVVFFQQGLIFSIHLEKNLKNLRRLIQLNYQTYLTNVLTKNTVVEFPYNVL